MIGCDTILIKIPIIIPIPIIIIMIVSSHNMYVSQLNMMHDDISVSESMLLSHSTPLHFTHSTPPTPPFHFHYQFQALTNANFAQGIA